MAILNSLIYRTHFARKYIFGSEHFFFFYITDHPAKLELFKFQIVNIETRDHRYMSCIVRKLDFCLCENKGADQLRSDCEADQLLCFC